MKAYELPPQQNRFTQQPPALSVDNVTGDSVVRFAADIFLPRLWVGSIWADILDSCMKQDTTDREIVNSRLFKHPRGRIFEAFSDPDHLTRWWGPKGFTNTFHSFDFRPGGQWRFTMHSPDGHDFKNECVFKEISEPDKIVIEHKSAPKFQLEVTLNETAGGTLLTWTQRFETAEMREKVIKFAGNANEENLDRLAGVLAAIDQSNAGSGSR